MLKRIVVILSTLTFAFLILSVSVMRCAAVNYAFSGPVKPAIAENSNEQSKNKIDYSLAYPGKILPDSPLWSIKALRDKLWDLVTTNASRKAELMLLFADKRLAASKILFTEAKSNVAYSTLTKALKYYEKAVNLEKANREKGIDTVSFQIRLNQAALKYGATLGEIASLAPDDAKPKIIIMIDQMKNYYKATKELLESKGLPVTENPLNWD